MTSARLTGATAVPEPDAGAMPEIPFRQAVLANGLTVIVHEDRRNPLVATQLRFNVGSKDEPEGRTGFAHLFEHLMFRKRPHLGGNWHDLLQELGGSDVNGSTSTDRTNYYQTVPKGALDRLLWMEADRMGQLLKSIDAQSLSDEISVVKNEKRQTEGAPYGLVYDTIATTLYPPHHPYGHSVLGSFADLDNANMEAVADWHTRWYGASNAVLVIAGDIGFDEAMEKVERWFGSLPAGQPGRQVAEWVPSIAHSRRITLTDRVPQRRLYLVWPTSNEKHRDTPLLSTLGSILSHGSHSRLNQRLVEQDRLCLGVTAYQSGSLLSGEFAISATLSPDADPEVVEQIIKEEVARIVSEGPTQAELDRARTMRRRWLLRSLDRLSGVAEMLAANHFAFGKADGHLDHQRSIDAATPEDLRIAAQRWLGAPGMILDVKPFNARSDATAPTLSDTAPAVIPTGAPSFPVIEKAVLSNGIPLHLARRPHSQNMEIALLLNSGARLDPKGHEGLSRFTMNALMHGTEHYPKAEFAKRMAEMGTSLSPVVTREYASLWFGGLKDQIHDIIDLMGEMLLRPTFQITELDQLRSMMEANVAAQSASPARSAAAAAARLIYGPGHPYGLPTEGTTASLPLLDRDLAIKRHAEWLDARAATLIVVGDITLSDAVSAAERLVADWPSAPPVTIPALGDWLPQSGRYLFETQPQAQSALHIAMASPDIVHGSAAQTIFNILFGGSFGSRLNSNLRERLGWTYGANSDLQMGRGLGAFHIRTSVQADRTQDAMAEIAAEISGLAKDRGVTTQELEDARNAVLVGMPARWATNGSVMQAVIERMIFNLPEGYEDELESRVRAVNVNDMAECAALFGDPDRYAWVVGGSADKVAGLDVTRVGTE